MTRPDQQLSEELLQHLPVGVLVVVDDSRVEWCNPRLCEYLGISREQVQALRPQSTNPAHLSALFEDTEILHVAAVAGHQEYYLKCEAVALSDNRKLKYYTDVTDKVRVEGELDRLRLSDELTGLPNLAGLLRALDPMVSRCRRYESPLSIAILQLNNLDELAGQYGSVNSDRLILCISRFMREETRWADMLGRVDQVSFIFVLQETMYEDAEKLTAKIKAKMPNLLLNDVPFDIEEVNYCFGISDWQKGDDVRSMINRAREFCIASLDE
jgi:diguanylate cyclase (GGDEF)-like protein